MPLVNRTFNQLIDFTRTTSGTYTNSSGFITSTPASVNLLTYTQEFANADWTKTNATITANSTAAPDGTLTADTMTDDATSGQHRIQQNPSGAAAGTTYAFSVYAKAGTNSFVQLLGTGGSGTNAWFTAIANLSTGAITQTGNGASGTLASSSITSVGNGWYRIVAVGSITGAAPVFRVAMVPAASGNSLAATDGTVSYVGTGTSIFIWGTQAEAASTATTYTRNYGGLYPPRFDYDPVTLAPKGLLIEEQRTNLLTYSEQFDNAAWSKTDVTVTANTTTSPDGTADADSYVEGTAGTAAIGQIFTGTANATFTVTIYVKRVNTDWVRLVMFETAAPTNRNTGWFNLSTGAVGSFTNGGTGSGATGSVSDAGNGWYRLRLTGAVNNSATALSFFVSSASADNSVARVNNAEYRLWGAQLEAGAFATSYIPTVASQVTRTADVAAINAPNFAPWYNPSEGTFVSAFDMVGGSAVNPSNQIVLSAVTDASNRHLIYNGSSQITGYTVVGGVDQAYLTTGSLAANTTSKMSYAYQVNSFAASQNGGSVSTDTSGSLPSPASFGIGSSGYGTAYLNGHIRSIRYYPVRLTNAQLQALTA